MAATERRRDAARGPPANARRPGAALRVRVGMAGVDDVMWIIMPKMARLGKRARHDPVCGLGRLFAPHDVHIGVY